MLRHFPSPGQFILLVKISIRGCVSRVLTGSLNLSYQYTVFWPSLVNDHTKSLCESHILWYSSLEYVIVTRVPSTNSVLTQKNPRVFKSQTICDAHLGYSYRQGRDVKKEPKRPCYDLTAFRLLALPQVDFH